MDTTGRSRAMEGWLAGCAAATGFLIAFALVILALGPGGVLSVRFVGSAIALLFPALLIFLITCLLTGIPAAVVISLGKKFQVRSFWFFGGAGALIGGLSQIGFFAVLLSRSPGPDRVLVIAEMTPLFVLAGLTAGLVYWYVAGKHAGRDCLRAWRL